MLPDPCPLPGRNREVPYVFVADAAFAASANLVKPHATDGRLNVNQRIFNYRISRARQVVECAFGILTANFRVLRTTIKLDPEKTGFVTMACISLYNYLRRDAEARARFNDFTYTPTPFPLPLNTVHNSQTNVQVISEFEDYFISPQGQLPWQQFKI